MIVVWHIEIFCATSNPLHPVPLPATPPATPLPLSLYRAARYKKMTNMICKQLGKYKRWVIVKKVHYLNFQRKFNLTLRKHAYSKILKILPPKNWNFSDKNLWYFSYFPQTIDCGYSLEPPRRGGSNEYPQSMFLSRNKKNNEYPCKPTFTI